MLTSPETESVIRIPLDELVESPSNPNKHFKAPAPDFVASVKELGVLQPIIVRASPKGKGHEIIFGHRRWRAANLAEQDDVPAIVRDVTDDQALEMQVVENSQRKDTHPVDEADAFAELVKRGYTTQRIAERIGRDPGYVVRRLRLCGLTKPSRKALDDGLVTIGVAELLAAMPDAGTQAKALEEVLPESYGSGAGAPVTVAYARKAIEANVMLALKGAPFKTTDAELVPKAGACSACPKRTGAQRELFSEASSPDLCTDPKCFRAKTDAVFQLRVKQHKAAGGEVLSATAAKKAVEEVRYHNGRYQELEQRVYPRSGKATTLKAIFGKEPPPLVLAADPETGRPVELVLRKDAEAAIAKLNREKPSGAKLAKNERSAAEQRERLKDKDRIEAVRRVMAALVAKTENLVVWDSVGPELLRGLALCALGSTWHDNHKRMAQRRAWLEAPKKPEKGKGRTLPPTMEEVIAKQIRIANARELAGIIVELLASRGAPAKYRDEPTDDFEALAGALKVRYDALHATVVEQRRAAGSGKKSPPKKPPKSPAKPKGKAKAGNKSKARKGGKKK